MNIDRPLLDFVRRGLLGFALVLVVSAPSGCASPEADETTNGATGTEDDDGDDDAAGSSEGATGDDSEGDGDDDSPDSVTPAAPARPSMVDASASATRPRDDAAAAKPDGGSPSSSAGATGGGADAGMARRDAGTDTPPSAPTPPSSTPPSPPTDAASGAHIRGEAPTQASASRRGPLAVRSYGTSEGAAFFSGTIYYPTEGEAPFSIVAVVPGFVSPEFTIQGWGAFLASHGMITMTLETNFLTDLPGDRADALWDALKTIKAEGKRNGSPINGKVDESRMGTMGWSMGGGGTLMVAESHPEIKATISLCGWNPLASYSRLRVPALMFAGTVDVLAGGQSQGFYQSIPNGTPKMLYEVTAGHTYANDPSGESGAVGRYGLSWMKVFLEGDERYRQFLTVKGPGTTDWRTNVK